MIKYNKTLKIFFFLFLSFFINVNVNAEEGMNDLSRGNYCGAVCYSSPNSSGGGGGGTYLVDTPLDGGFRFTLVDQNGNIVPGTHSVDFTGDVGFRDRSANYQYINAVLPFDDYSYFNLKTNNSGINNPYPNGFTRHQGFYYHKYGIGNNLGSTNRVANNSPYSSIVLLNQPYGTHDFFPSPSNFEAFKYYIMNPSTQKLWTYNGRNVSFFDYFLHKCGYLNDRPISLDDYYDPASTDPDHPDKYRELWTKHYYLIAEPLYEIAYAVRQGESKSYLYGTISEFAYQLKNNFAYDSWVRTSPHYNYGTEGGLTNELERASANFCTLSNDGVKTFSSHGVALENGICKEIKCSDFALCSRNTDNFKAQEKRYYYAASKDYGYGVSTISVNRIIPNPNTLVTCTGSSCESLCTEPSCKPTCTGPSCGGEPVIINSALNVALDLCASNDGIISFRINASSFEYFLDVDNISNSDKHPNFNSSLFKVQGDENQSVYCYDDVIYNFSNLLENMNQEHRRMSIVSFNSPKLNVTRTCIYRKDSNVTYDFEDKIKADYSHVIPVTMLGQTFSFIPNLNYNLRINAATDILDSSGNAMTFSDGYKYVKATATLSTYYYLDDGSNNIPGYDDLIDIPVYYSTSYSDAMVYFGDQVFKLFGASNNVLEYLSEMTPGQVNTVTRTYNQSGRDYIYNNSYSYEVNDGGITVDNLRCYFKPNIQSYEPDDYLLFRTISLNNPFPARDGSSRLPAENWLSDVNNKVYDYISANRGVRYYNKDASGEALYSTDEIEPMYTITLTPSTMKKIREYNKTHQYDSMYHENTLNCNSNDRECFSTFLRNHDYIPSDSFKGSCVITDSSDSTVIRNSLNLYDTLDISANSDYYSRFMNGNGSYERKYDLNKNGRIDNEDYNIYNNYFDSVKTGKSPANTKFYTCANKSYFSGGPVGGVN